MQRIALFVIAGWTVLSMLSIPGCMGLDPAPSAQQNSEDDKNEADSTKRVQEIVEDVQDGYVPDPFIKDSELPVVSANWVRLAEDQEVWIDTENSHVIVGGFICLRQGPLEMFACPIGLKEHESVVSVNASSKMVHTALLAVGAEPISPVKYEPEYVPVQGTTIKIDATWLEEGKTKTTDARNWVRNMQEKKPLSTDWVFGGSVETADPNTGQVFYEGDAGMMICVSNFTIATMDIPIQSSELSEYWLFEAFTDNIPPRGTRVLLTLKPQLAEQD